MDITRTRQMYGTQTTVLDMLSNQIFMHMHNAIPCIIQRYDSQKNIVDCKPAIRERIAKPDGEVAYIEYPMLINVPVIFPSTANSQITFPLEKNDECLVIFSDLSIDNFWLKGSIQNPVEDRRHDLSDGLAIPCNLSQPRVTPAGSGLTIKYKNTSVQINEQDLIFTTPVGSFTGSELYGLIHRGE